jgi:phospholipid/cholesterol/gamma-HCH transport system permease protein
MTPAPPPTETQAALGRARAAIEGPSRIPVVDAAGEYTHFLLRGIRGIASVTPYSGEVLRQASLIALGSVLVIVWMSFLTGAVCGVTGSAISRAIGAGVAAPIFSAFCTTRAVFPFIFGFIVAAKIGGGIVAQLGAMRVSEEVDAMDVMGVSSIVYLISTRMLAAIVMLPVAYLVGWAAAQGGAWIASLVRGAEVSQGTWEFAFYTAIDPVDLIYSLTKGLVISFAVIATALYYGYRVSGGPVEVGEAVARSMAVNLLTVTVLNMILTFIFWGFNPNLPVA